MSKKILVVEDEPVSLRVISQLLESHGYTVVTASDGSTAASTAMSQHPDLVVLDLSLPSPDPFTGPRWDGFGVLEWLNRMITDHRIPVIVLTSHDPAQAQQRAFAAGAVAVFQKPADEDQLLAAIRSAFGEPN